jgi:DNA-binding MurR/RpiR family transcriptional regulator
MQVNLQYGLRGFMLELYTALESYQGKLTTSEERLIQELLSRPEDAALMSAADLAKRVGVHEATAVRLAQKLGYDGYPALRNQLQSNLIQHAEPAKRVQEKLSRVSEGNVLDGLIESEVKTLLELSKHVQQSQLDAAALLLAKAQRTFLFAHGHATSLVEFLDRRLRRSGLVTIPIPYRGRDLAEHLHLLTKQDVVLSFALHTRPPGYVALHNYAKKVAAKTLVISDQLGPTLRPTPTLLLSAPRGPKEEFQTLVVPMTLCNALVLRLAQLDEGRSLKSLNGLSRLVDQFENDD